MRGEISSKGKRESSHLRSKARDTAGVHTVRAQWDQHINQQISGLSIWMHFYSHTSTQKPTWPTEQHRAKVGLKQRRKLLDWETERTHTLSQQVIWDMDTEIPYAKWTHYVLRKKSWQKTRITVRPSHFKRHTNKQSKQRLWKVKSKKMITDTKKLGLVHLHRRHTESCQHQRRDTEWTKITPILSSLCGEISIIAERLYTSYLPGTTRHWHMNRTKWLKEITM